MSGVLEELKEATFFFFLRFCRNASSMDGIDELIETESPDRTLGSLGPKGIRFVMTTVLLWLSGEKKGASVKSQQYQLFPVEGVLLCAVQVDQCLLRASLGGKPNDTRRPVEIP
jgi:hypothetical protein